MQKHLNMKTNNLDIDIKVLDWVTLVKYLRFTNGTNN